VNKSLNLYEDRGCLKGFISKLYENMNYLRTSVSLFRNTCLKIWNNEISTQYRLYCVPEQCFWKFAKWICTVSV